MTAACMACGITDAACRKQWTCQRKCCPDCSHGAPALPRANARYSVLQPWLPNLQLGLDLEPLLRGALLAEMATVLQRHEPRGVEREPFVVAFYFCPRCGRLVPAEAWGEDNGTHPGSWLRCRACIRNAANRRERDSERLWEPRLGWSAPLAPVAGAVWSAPLGGRRAYGEPRSGPGGARHGL